MSILVFAAALASPAICLALGSGGADFSACYSAESAKDPHQKISLFTTCLKHGNIGAQNASLMFVQRGFAYQSTGEVEKAFQDFDAAVRYDPNWPIPFFGRSTVESGRGLCRQALADIDTAMKMGPPRAPFLNHAAWVLATCADPQVRDGAKAIALAQQALKIREDPDVRDTLAAAYAEVGRYEDARAEEAKAVAGVRERPQQVDAMQARLELYSHNLPFHTAQATSAPTGAH